MSSPTIDDLPEHIRNFMCPISHEIMLSPVFASDGQLYEEIEFSKYLTQLIKQKHKLKSPITRERLVKCNKSKDNVCAFYVNAIAIKSMLDKYFNEHVEHISLRYMRLTNIDEFNGLESDDECVAYLLSHRDCFAHETYLCGKTTADMSKYKIYYKSIFSLLKSKRFTSKDIDLIKHRTYGMLNDYIICGIFAFYPSCKLNSTQFVPSVELCYHASEMLITYPKLFNSIILAIFKQNKKVFYDYCSSYMEDYKNNIMRMKTCKKISSIMRCILHILNSDYEENTYFT